MEYYFMTRVPGLKGAVTLADFPNVDGQTPWPDDMIAHVTWTDGQKWNVRDLCEIKAGTATEFTEDDLPQDCPENASPFFFLYPEKLPAALDQLIVSPIMTTSPGWRGNLKVMGKTTSASYQGEYPSFMVKIHQGTLLSFATFVQNTDKVKTQFVLPNLRQDPAVEDCVVRFLGSKSKTVFKDITVKRNHTTVVDVSAPIPHMKQHFADMKSRFC
ncbi:MAG: hypothetical protein HQL35_15875, partial [Alphaproteobacteria bacterium]|nr:hypothetical protein [Alphaproteobacteria bacterium]